MISEQCNEKEIKPQPGFRAVYSPDDLVFFTGCRLWRYKIDKI